MNAGLREELLRMQAADLQLRQRLVEEGVLHRGYHYEMAAWLVLQHCILDPELMRMALPLLGAAVDRGEAPPAHLAYLADRIRTLQGEPQLYGTQHDWDDAGQMSPLPMEDAEGVEARRGALGMESLAAHTFRLRAQVAREGAARPADLAAYRRERDEWARSTGWRS